MLKFDKNNHKSFLSEHLLCPAILCALVLFSTVFLVVLSPFQAFAYNYLTTNTTTVFPRTFVSASEQGYLELIGCDPHDTTWHRPCWQDESGGCYGYVSRYQWAVWSAAGGKDDLRYYDAWRGSWIRNGFTFGSGTGETQRYGYGFGDNVISSHGGFDQLLHIHAYIDSATYPQPAVRFKYGESSLWPRVLIAYDAQGGRGAPGSHYKYIGRSAHISHLQPTRLGYTFEGWSTNRFGPVNIAPGQYIGLEDWNLQHPVYMSHIWNGAPSNFWHDLCGGTPSPSGSNTITLYAQWKPITYSVMYEGNGATGGSTARSVHTYDVSRSLTPNDYKRSYRVVCDCQGGSSGSISLGCTWPWRSWNTRANGSGVAYHNKEVVRNLLTTRGSATLYAQWDEGKIRLPDPGIQQGKIFAGWYTLPEGGHFIGYAHDEVVVGSDTTYYAHWQARAPITYYSDGELLKDFTEQVCGGSVYHTTQKAWQAACKPGCSGFEGWFTDSACTKAYQEGSPVPAQGLCLYGRNTVHLSYAFTTQTSDFLAQIPCYTDPHLTVALKEPTSLLPSDKDIYFGDRVLFGQGPTLWFEERNYPREVICDRGVYSTAHGSGVPATSMLVTKNTTVYLRWRQATYDGIEIF